jgi:nucleoside-diphosphate-sugar epimerase
MNVFVVGISGGTGSRIARLLIDQEHSVSGLYRHPSQGGKLKEMGAEGFAGDIATISEQELARAISDTEVVVFTAGAGDLDDESMIDAVDYGGVKKNDRRNAPGWSFSSFIDLRVS